MIGSILGSNKARLTYSEVGVAQVIRYEIHTTNSVVRASVVSAESLNNVIENGRCSYQ